tara:strand:+ start:1458 stop:1754 length:297 start_codon:yes stop_codon:yes gene_type:complete
MNITQLTENSHIIESKIVWARKGNSVARKYRCTFGRRAGRVVAEPSQCAAPIDIKKRFTLKRTKAKMGARLNRKAQRTKRLNPASKRVAKLNKPLRRK